MCTYTSTASARSQAAQAIAGLILQHSAWKAACVLLRACALLLPAGKAQLLARLEASLASLEACAPTGQPQVSAPGTSAGLPACQPDWMVCSLSQKACLGQGSISAPSKLLLTPEHVSG